MKYQNLYDDNKPDSELLDEAIDSITINLESDQDLEPSDLLAVEEGLERRREHFFKHPSKELQELIKTNMIDRKPLWIEFLKRGRMSTKEMKEFADFKEKGVAGFTGWLKTHGLARNVGYDKLWKGAVFEIYPEVIQDLKRLIGIE